MNKLTDVEIFANEILCIRRRASGICNGGTDCNTCDLLMNEVEIIEAYQRAMKHNDLIKRQKAEIERLKHILVSFMSEVENWEHKYGVDTSNIPKIAVLGTEKENCIKQVKSEAYREFWMKLRTHGHKMMGSDWSGEFCAKAILVEDGDNLLKELTESKNDLEG